MIFHPAQLLAILFASTAGALDINEALNTLSSSQIINRDVAVIGGGSSGTHAAINLRDQGKSVVVIEKQGRLGGHTETYTDEATGRHVEFGVTVFHRLDVVTKYFGRFNITPVASTRDPSVNKYVDYRTGKLLDYQQPTPSVGLANYGAQLAQYPYIEEGFDLPSPVPEDLYLPFGDFAVKYGIESAVPFLYSFAQGLGDFLAQSTLYVFKNFGVDLLRGLQVGFLTTTNNSELYDKATAELGSDVLLNSKIIDVRRQANLTRILIQTSSGMKLIQAKKLLLTIPPKLDNLRPFDLDEEERRLFSQFQNSAYYAAVIKNSGIPDDWNIHNVGSDTPYNTPPLPGLYQIYPTGIPNTHNVKFGSPTTLSDAEVKKAIVQGIENLRTAGTANTTVPEFAAFAAHVPFELTVPAAAIKAGFYKDLTALQGRKNTFYSGAAFHTHDSSMLWQFNEALIPRILASL